MSDLSPPQPSVRLITAILARNEADPSRYLRRVIQGAMSWSDMVLVLDDHSTDETPAICREEGAWVIEREDAPPAWGNEAPARKELWDLAVEAADSGWLLILDADMTLSADPRPLMMTQELNSWAFPLYDLWDGEETYRADAPWQGHVTPRIWMVCPSRVPENWVADWPKRGIHCGHLPHNWPAVCGTAPEGYWLNHYAYVKPEHRQAKHEQYMSKAEQLTEAELLHVRSILDA